MFIDDKDRQLILELKEQISMTLLEELIDPEVEALEDIHDAIDSLIVCNNEEEYIAVKDAVKSSILDIAYVLEVTTNYYVRKNILPLIDELTADIIDD